MEDGGKVILVSQMTQVEDRHLAVNRLLMIWVTAWMSLLAPRSSLLDLSQVRKGMPWACQCYLDLLTMRRDCKNLLDCDGCTSVRSVYAAEAWAVQAAGNGWCLRGQSLLANRTRDRTWGIETSVLSSSVERSCSVDVPVLSDWKVPLRR